MHMKGFFGAVLLVAALTLLPASAFAAVRSLSLGMSGSDVTALQNALISGGYLAAGKNSGYFGALTQAAVEKFQCDKNIICSGDAVAGYGIAGPKTQAALGTGSGVTKGTQNPSTVTGTMTPAATGAFEVSGWLPDWRAASATT